MTDSNSAEPLLPIDDGAPSQTELSGQPSGATTPEIVVIVAAAALFTGAIFRGEMLQSANDRSRWCTVWSLVERGTYQIDEIDRNPKWSTIDKVRYRHADDEPWHFYSSKPPLFPTMVAGLYWLETKTLGFNLNEHTDTTGRLLLIAINAVPMILALSSLGATLRLLDVTLRVRCVLLVTAAFASMLTPFLTTLNNHTPAATCLVFCLSAMIRIRLSDRPRGRDFAIVGVTAALVTCFELPAALFGIVSFLFVAVHDRKSTLRYYVPGAIVPLALFFATNWIVTGGIKPFYAYYGKEPYVYVHEGIPSYWSNPQGIDANAESTLTYAFHCVLGHHGFLSLTPVFLLSLVGPFISLTGRFQRGCRVVLVIGGVLSAAILSFYLTRYENYNYGGNTAALRWLLWLTPFWWLAMVPALEFLLARRFGFVVVILLFCASVYSTMYSLTTPWKPGWIYERMSAAGIVDYSVRIPPFEPRQFTLIRSIPEADGTTYSWFGVQDAKGGELLMTPQKLTTYKGEPAVLMRVVLTEAAEDAAALETREANAVVLTERLRKAGDVPSWCIVVSDDVVAAVMSGNAEEVSAPKLPPEWLQNTLRGMPSVRSFNAESARYLSFWNDAGEKTAIRCRRGAGQVAVDHPQHGACRHRCDVLFNDDLPFGLVQWRTTVRSNKSGQIVENKLWTTRHLPR